MGPVRLLSKLLKDGANALTSQADGKSNGSEVRALGTPASFPSAWQSGHPDTLSFPPFPVPARGFYLEDGFVTDMPAPLLQLNTIPLTDWSRFLRDIASCARRAAAKAGSKSPRTAGWLDAQSLVGRWNLEYFAPRGVNVALVGIHIDDHTARKHHNKHHSRGSSSSSTTSSSSSSSSSSEDDKRMLATTADVHTNRRAARRAARSDRRARKARRREERRARKRGKGVANGPGGLAGGSEPIRLIVSCTTVMYRHGGSEPAGGQSSRGVNTGVEQSRSAAGGQSSHSAKIGLPPQTEYRPAADQHGYPQLPLTQYHMSTPHDLMAANDVHRQQNGTDPSRQDLPPPPYSPYEDQEDIPSSSVPRGPPADVKDRDLF
ncbi:hypothetical protein HDU86_002031 [Geranomyces michiganensis]|nr:hypothetical protein HDU86_002031 [Geranomyces michiganensis]